MVKGGLGFEVINNIGVPSPAVCSVLVDLAVFMETCMFRCRYRSGCRVRGLN